MHFKIMRKSVFIAAAAAAVLVLGACTHNEVTTSGEHEFSFTTYAPKALARADASYVGGATLVKGQNFVVYGYNQKAGVFSETLAPNFINGMPVLYNGGNTVDNAGLNTYSPKRYWPYDEANNKLAFYAYYPKENGGEITPNVTAGLGTYSVKVPADPASQSDFLVSDLKVDQVYSKTTDKKGVVELLFRHQLAKIIFRVKTDETDEHSSITLNSLTIKNVLSEGTLTPSYSAEGGSATAWSGQSAPVDLDVVSSDALLSSTPVGSSDSTSYFILLPQKLADNLTADFVFTISTEGTEPIVNKASIKLNELRDADGNLIDEWHKNNFIVYTFSISLGHEIKFAATSIPWDEEKDVVYPIN